MTCAPSQDSDQPGHPPSLIRVFAVCSVGNQRPSASLCRQRRLWSDWADLILRRAHSSFCWFCPAAAQRCFYCPRMCQKHRHSSKQCRPWSDSLREQSDQGLHCFVKYICNMNKVFLNLHWSQSLIVCQSQNVFNQNEIKKCLHEKRVVSFVILKFGGRVGEGNMCSTSTSWSFSELVEIVNFVLTTCIN